MKIIHNWDHKIISDFLFSVFEREKDDLLLQAAADATMRWNLAFALDYENLGVNNFGGTVNYNKKKRQFDYISYSDKKNFAVIISIESRCYYSAWDHRNWLYFNVPQFYYPDKKLTKWLLAH